VRDALRIRPGYRDALVLLARIMERQGRWDAATVVWRQLLMVDPMDPEARQVLPPRCVRAPADSQHEHEVMPDLGQILAV
jgi:cytochrome c-type biogenesis protein CcmH/NrfG